MAIKVITTNRKAFHEYHIGESVEAGIALNGSEIKSIRDGRITLGEAYVRPERGEMWLLNANIARYGADGRADHEPTRTRKLLLHRREIANLTSQVNEKGLTLVPVKVYLKDDLAKVEIAVARGKKLYDKREAILKREADREMGRAAKNAKR